MTRRIVVTYMDGLRNIGTHEISTRDKDGELLIYPNAAGGFMVNEKRGNVLYFRSQWAPNSYIMVEEQDYFGEPIE